MTWCAVEKRIDMAQDLHSRLSGKRKRRWIFVGSFGKAHLPRSRTDREDGVRPWARLTTFRIRPRRKSTRSTTSPSEPSRLLRQEKSLAPKWRVRPPVREKCASSDGIFCNSGAVRTLLRDLAA